MKKRNVVRSKILFNDIIQKGKKISNKYFIVCFLNKNIENCNFGLAVGKKLGNAVVRNKLKRQLRCIIDNNIDIFSKYKDYIIICKKELLNLKYNQIENELKTLIKGELNEK